MFWAPKVQTPKGGLSQKKLNQVIDYIQINLYQELRLATIAQEIGINQSYFCTLFKQSTGITPYQYTLLQRIERAKQLLKQPNITIVDVAIQSGFANKSHFTKHFSQFTGVTPKVYQEQA
ncbi:hypothetical protein DSM106972_061190 [Dulcicalothrix desertica PCC 7102]|uniref:HTH araC/xylS-type domain-containing protein n=1 Tax=Dulcicalothrix desertica PCC 7102 TaxID=232991 RepID=A0A3S1D1N7_9CYAN|nr:hypothetical protein DSM106972_061190 [Dulcicalothrix desertica PCC 7102]